MALLDAAGRWLYTSPSYRKEFGAAIRTGRQIPCGTRDAKDVFVSKISREEPPECVTGRTSSRKRYTSRVSQGRRVLWKCSVVVESKLSQSEDNLFPVGEILGLLCAFLHAKECRQGEAGQNCDDRDDDQQFD